MPTPIPSVKQPLWFVYSSLKKEPPIEEETDLGELKALTDKLKHLFPNPSQLKDVCIMALNRRQVFQDSNRGPIK